ncbi:MAG: putative hydroxymethylpyrimidine transporter CytX [Armatimonadota bacterium]|nr:putative hydroxymethylpyrimidine transporter CytX [Armatimonadota bacterium]MDR7448368.1 putative hydroxymethylpyrimidine transporter CytX [Armatimonadota bacterium]MDR7459769.1 putative hydroxymethylpyrimidine transporter CytX [Armatimonadota bacterium]MDR7479268.1 putative hydroxymethylpyrimidine transporter CytX [Armatimonadota bacterium]MDR7489045.1 putative hydroxymethylpyrimidine transporter CytX [Armatimonadota bacterium]
MRLWWGQPTRGRFDVGVLTLPRPRLQVPPAWGIEPVPAAYRRLGFLDFFALWSSLGVGLLVLAAGGLLVPGMSPRAALGAIVLGTLIGNLLLALTGLVGSRTALPTMVLLRPVLGLRGSYLPTVLNVVQLVGWGAFEVYIMAQAADAISRQLTGLHRPALWALLFAAIATLLALGGPLVVVRRWLERFAIWLVYATTLYLTGYLLTHHDLRALLARPGTGALPFWLGVDLVVAMPVSWMPLVADYNRFAQRPAAAFWGTYLGYFLANVWFYALGALFVLALRTQEVIPAVLSVAGGALALLLLLVDETDNAFANIYSTALSLQNILPRAPQRLLIVLVGTLCFVVAVNVNLVAYEAFLFLIGAVFVPLFGVLAADYFVPGGRARAPLSQAAADGAGRAEGAGRGVSLPGLVAWAVGFLVYQWIAPTALPGWEGALRAAFTAVGLPFPLRDVVPWLGGSVPGFLAALVAYALLRGVWPR